MKERLYQTGVLLLLLHFFLRLILWNSVMMLKGT
ncbi:hypothetical protein Bcer98_3693 [Bacillus cytotoxicus NVH 391-98]|uniref:Uncharacterized protein n=2 Tax=Bacillus cytotoxicus TaxID=580165 RepID=A0AAX2CMK7_9BACI|nr:hypothetical protein Bcer98_3693 [Bacillus cytotoxicus NVH 391-98]SCM05829.1 Protein of unknown function [Bacillus cytotoxicus]SCN42597.1 Protein of unknown function [Bacillus cytotoxicus]